jgi:hypothetical protein
MSKTNENKRYLVYSKSSTGVAETRIIFDTPPIGKDVDGRTVTILQCDEIDPDFYCVSISGLKKIYPIKETPNASVGIQTNSSDHS